MARLARILPLILTRFRARDKEMARFGNRRGAEGLESQHAANRTGYQSTRHSG